MTSRQQPSQVQSALTDLKDYADQLGDDHLFQLLYHLEKALDAAPTSGDYVGGDSITAGDIIGGTGVAIGKGNQVSVDQSHTTTITLQQTFKKLQDDLAALPAQKPAVTPQAAADAQAEVEELKPEVLKGDQADEGSLMRHIRNIARMGPDILDVVTATLVNPAAGVATVVRKIAAKAREEGGLEVAG